MNSHCVGSRSKVIVFSLGLLVLLSPHLSLMSEADASPRVSKAERAIKRIARLEKRLQRLGERLRPQQRSSLLSRVQFSARDSDQDGLPDYLDDARCNSNYDDDDSSDRSDWVNDGNIDDDRDSQDDDESSRFDDDSSTEGQSVYGNLVQLTSNSVQVDSLICRVTSNTQFLDEDGNVIGSSAFQIGECVELECDFRQGEWRAEALEEEDDC